MKAIPTAMTAIRAHRRGGPEVLVVETAPVPAPGSGEVLIAVRAAAITFAELGWDETWLRDGHDRTPIIPSHEVAGVVAALGAGVRDFRIGDTVFGLIPFDHDGAAAEYVTVSALDVAALPVGISYTDAAGMALPTLTAWQALVDHAHTRAGDRVLVTGGGGGVGLHAVQVARYLGAEVTALVRTADMTDLLLSLGVGEVVVGGPPAGRQFDVILDAQGGPMTPALYDAAADHGRLVTLSAPPPAELGAARGISSTFFVVRPDRAQLELLATLAVRGALRPMVATIVPLTHAADAYAGRGLSGRPGKTVLHVADDTSTAREV